MRSLRRPALVAGLTALAVTASALASSPAVKLDVRTKFKTVLPKVQESSGVPIRLPKTVFLNIDRTQKTYVSGRGTASSYSFFIDLAPGCNGAGACDLGLFEGRRGLRLASGGQKVKLAKGLTGNFLKSSCGANCSFPEIQWIQNHVRYTISLGAGSSPQAELDALRDYANQAIRRPRL